MQESAEVRDAVERFWGCLSRADFDELDRALTRGDIAQVIGSAPGEGHDDRDGWVDGFRSLIESMPGVRVEPGPTQGFANGDTGYAIGEPTWHLPVPGGATLTMRTTLVLQREDGEWRIVHLHASVGVPDEQAVQMQAEERAASGAA